MDVTLKPELEKLIRDEVTSGRSSDPNEFLNRAIYHYVVARDLGETYTAEEIDRMISEGLDDIQRGDTLEGDDAFKELAEKRSRATAPSGRGSVTRF